MRHPAPGALLELHFGESTGLERDALSAHVPDCPHCAGFLAEVHGLEHALAPGADDGPPADGLERVLRHVGRLKPAQAPRAEWARAAVPSAAALLAGAWAIRAGADRLLGLGLVPALSAGPMAGDLLGLTLAALGVVAAGALVTLALAPVLILESHRRS